MPTKKKSTKSAAKTKPRAKKPVAARPATRTKAAPARRQANAARSTRVQAQVVLIALLAAVFLGFALEHYL